MARQVVGTLTLIAAGSRRPPDARVAPTSALVGMLLKAIWLNSRIAGIGIWAFCSAMLISAMWGSGAPFTVTVLAPIGLATLCLLFPWVYLRSRLRSRHRAAILAMEDVFAAERVTLAEWQEAKRLIRRVDPEFFRYGNGAHLDQRCVL